MMQVMPMPCCGAEPPVPTSRHNFGSLTIEDTTDWSKFGWDPRTGLCRACGEDKRHFRCESPKCSVSVDRFQRFCDGCQGAFELGVIEDIGPWSPDPAASGPRHRAFPGGGYHLCAYEDGRWFVEYKYDQTIGSGTVSDVMPDVLATAKLLCVGTWKQHSRTTTKTGRQHFDELMDLRERMKEHHPECVLNEYNGCVPNCPGLKALMETEHE